jgi:hypothetical protein
MKAESTPRHRTHESASGTNRTNRAGLMMSVDRGKSEVAFRGRQDRFDPLSNIRPPSLLVQKNQEIRASERRHKASESVRFDHCEDINITTDRPSIMCQLPSEL